MLVKYYLSDNINATFEDFTLDLQNAWAGPGSKSRGNYPSYFLHD